MNSQGRLEARQLLAEVFDLELADIPDDASIRTFDAWDSVAHVRIILAIEERTGQPLSSESIAMLASIDDIATLIDRAGVSGTNPT